MRYIKRTTAVCLALCLLLAGIPMVAASAAQNNSLWISEVCFNPAYEIDTRKVTGDNDYFEYIEIKNVSNANVDLKNAKVKYCTGGASGDAWYEDMLVFESKNDGVMGPGEVWVIGYYSRLTAELSLGYGSDSEMAAFWKTFNAQYGCSLKTTNRVICTVTPSGGGSTLPNAINLPNTGAKGAIRIVAGDLILGAIEYSPDKYNVNSYALQTKYQGGAQSLAGVAGCTPGTILTYQEPDKDTRSAASGDALSFVSFNICYDVTITDPANATLDQITVEKRAPRLLSYLNGIKKDIVCLQEVNNVWFPLLDGKMPGYQWLGDSNRGNTGGQSAVLNDVYNPIFYNTATVTLVEGGNFWLHEETANNSNKVCTWALFRMNSTGSLVAIFNAHLSVDDSDGTYTRRQTETTNLLNRMKAKLKELNKNHPTETGSIGAVLCGDFNVNEGTLLYRQVVNAGFLEDCKYKARKTENLATYTNWGNYTPENGTIIDFCFVNSGVDLRTYNVKENNLVGGLPISDHNAIELSLFVTHNAETEKKNFGAGISEFFAKFFAFFKNLVQKIGEFIRELMSELPELPEEPVTDVPVIDPPVEKAD